LSDRSRGVGTRGNEKRQKFPSLSHHQRKGIDDTRDKTSSPFRKQMLPKARNKKYKQTGQKMYGDALGRRFYITSMERETDRLTETNCGMFKSRFCRRG